MNKDQLNSLLSAITFIEKEDWSFIPEEERSVNSKDIKNLKALAAYMKLFLPE